MTEVTPRTPHVLTYLAPDGRYIVAEVDNMGRIAISEEAFDILMRLGPALPDPSNTIGG